MNDNAVSGFTRDLSGKMAEEISKAVLGQYAFVEQLVAAFLSGGHVLVEGVPGQAKTLAARALARTVKAGFKRIQFTPDLMPADITGTKVYDSKSGSFYFKKGPVFCNILLADEINRTPPKTQSALLEVMEERSVTIDGETHVFEEPFFVEATQNPIEYEGTYPLPEAQLDRFLMKLHVDYIPQKFENMLLQKYCEGFSSNDLDSAGIQAVCTPDDIARCKVEIRGVKVDESVIRYMTSITRATRASPALMLGASPRASVMLLAASRTWAAMQGRDFVIPEDVKELAFPVLRHRIILKPEAAVDGAKPDDVLRAVLGRVEVPR